MKRFSILAVLVLAMASVVAQEYKSRQPTPSEQRRIAGLGYYPQDANEGRWQLYAISNSGTNIWLRVGSTNNIIIVTGATAGQTNILVFPNATNSVGAVFNIVAAGATTTILSNSVTGSFNSLTNPPNSGASAPSTFQVQSNRVVKVISPNGTNWFVTELRGNVP